MRGVNFHYNDVAWGLSGVSEKRLTHPTGKWLLKLYLSIPCVPSATLWEDFEDIDHEQDENYHYVEPCLLYSVLDWAWPSDMESA